MATLASHERSTRNDAELGRESWDPPQRISSLPPLDTHEAQSRFLCSPTAVLDSLGLRIPAALARHLRRSDPPPAPAAAPQPALSARLAPEATASEAVQTPTSAPAKPKRSRKKK